MIGVFHAPLELDHLVDHKLTLDVPAIASMAGARQRPPRKVDRRKQLRQICAV